MRSLVALVIIGLSLSALAAEKPATAQERPAAAQPALPAGHPALPAADSAQPALPPGHPPMPANNGAAGLPSGHPQLPGNPAATGLPAGHPQVNPSSALLPPGTKASIAIKAVQATKDGPAVAADPVVVEYYNVEGEVVGRNAATLSDKGQVTIKDIALTVPVQPLITVTHAGVEYKAPGTVMDGTTRDQEVAVNVYETTTREPTWQVRMRHVIVDPARDGLNVTEMISVFNPTDRAWTGRQVNTGLPVTLELVLPPTATNVRAGGAFRDNAVKLEDGKLLCSMPLLPGPADFQVHYRLPAENDRAEVTLWAPAATASLFVFLPADGSTVTSDDLKLVQAKPGAQLRANSRFYTAPPQNAGDAIRFTVSGLKALKPSASADTPGEGGEAPAATGSSSAPGTAGIPNVAKVAGGITAAAILTVGTAVIFYKSPKAAGAKR
jgi:hypothetical protein